MPYAMEICKDKAKWDAFVAGSPQDNVFCKTAFLDGMGEEYDLVLLSEDGIPQLGAVIVKQAGRPAPAPRPFTTYQGVLCSRELHESPSHRKVKATLEACEFLFSRLSEAYDRISFCLHPGFRDARGFQWFHYHQPELGRFRLDLAYTGIIDLKAAGDFENYLSKVRKVRRYEYNRAARDGLILEASRDVELLAHLHHLTLAHQGHETTDEEARLVKSISTQALEKGFGELVVCRTPKGEAASAVLFLFNGKQAYYLFGANHPDFRDSNSGNFLMLEQIKRSFEKGMVSVDVVGINSPNRGDFKTSLGAEPFPYFIANWEKP
jgi:hypothetical protein